MLKLSPATGLRSASNPK
ncbi:hypothetical protein EYF80_068397 [Liparis tanakae]|uniref:Uncharacterized protein n=1 Tax=Liparis tanakae TaxID=230148 RepID=A0A4Z2DZB8_9TELE|nr:hypothetical protein EYF80_068397 [Liparis tanakae]